MAGTSMLKLYRGPSESKQLGALKDPAKSTALPGVPVVVSNPTKIGAPHKKGVKTLGKKVVKPKDTVAKGY